MAKRSSKPVGQDALAVLAESSIEGHALRLPVRQLDRKLYVDVNDALERIGGCWDKRSRTHVFDGDPSEALSTILDSGLAPDKNPFDYWPTPRPVVLRMIEIAGPFSPGMRILEPSVGEGAIAIPVLESTQGECQLYAVEFDASRDLRQLNDAMNVGDHIVSGDFLTWSADGLQFDRILMNPPFNAVGRTNVFVDHILRAYDLLTPNGILVSVAPSSIRFRPLLDLIDDCGTVESLPSGSFASSGTGVNTVLVGLRKPRE